MIYRTDSMENFALPLAIGDRAWQLAHQFAQQQPTPEKAAQVKHNTLAVAVVNDYLQMLGIATDLPASDSWNPVMHLCADVADLVLPGVGRLECRPLLGSGEVCPIPPEVWEDRVGYVVVHLDEQEQEATLLGFTATATEEELPLSQLRSPESLIDHLHTLMQSVEVTTPELALAGMGQTLVNLAQWFQGEFDRSWQAVEALLNPPGLAPAYAFRNLPPVESPDRVRRAKLLDLGIQTGNQQVALVVELRPEAQQQTGVLLQVHPLGNQTILPADLQLIVLDETDQVFLEARSRGADNYIQLAFSGTTGEQFSVRLAISGASVTETFVI